MPFVLQFLPGALCLLAAAGVGALLGGLRWKRLKEEAFSTCMLYGGIGALCAVNAAWLLCCACRVMGGTVAAYLLPGACGLAVWGLYFAHPLPLVPESSPVPAQASRELSAAFRRTLGVLGGFCFLGAFFWAAGAGETRRGVQIGAVLFAGAAFAWALWSEGRNIRAALREVENRLDRQYQKELLDFMQVVRSQRHDLNFHMQAVAAMIEQKQYDACTRYIRELVQNTERLNEVLPLSNPAIAAQIAAFQEIAAMQRVRLDVQVLSQLEHLPCSLVEINTILGNLLQNALDEVSGKPEAQRWVRLLLMRRSHRYILKVSNPSSKAPAAYADVFHTGYSTKHSHEGLGLANVHRIAARCGGTVYLEHDPGVVHFIVRLPERTQP